MENENQMEAAKAMEIAEDVLTELCMDWSPEILAMNEWVRIDERLPENVGWYLVSVRELNDLGFSKFTDIVGYVHSSERGFYWDVRPGTTVEAWQERPAPYQSAPQTKDGGGE